MKLVYLTIMTTILSSLALSANATESYKRVPFNVSVHKGDTVNVNYDFAEKKAIVCTSDYAHVRIDFDYKGRKKFANLPIILQSDHVPNKKNEALADLQGRFTLSLTGPLKAASYSVNCHYPDTSKNE